MSAQVVTDAQVGVQSAKNSHFSDLHGEALNAHGKAMLGVLKAKLAGTGPTLIKGQDAKGVALSASAEEKQDDLVSSSESDSEEGSTSGSDTNSSSSEILSSDSSSDGDPKLPNSE